MNHKSNVYYNQVIREYAEEGKSCWSISLQYFTALLHTLPLKDQRFIQDNEVSMIEFMERIETGAWGRSVRLRQQDTAIDCRNFDGLTSGAVYAAFV
ncbi:hypothetical protein [Paenibacillus hexagrammi]|uniref:Uncharacterized protein n=1 Tax=Paenibacillus hexagrammi TaxID=2908839 RepID=A0ABY3SQY1_9BACL|nr:hypothetical protein [Paenibacillus sp. YPD9-1]UJF35878.1 hypothetical protein L0M14_12820 [Paenibacillus sp. YPD9-1]